MEQVVDAGPVARETEPETFQLLGGPLELLARVAPPAGDTVLFRSRMEPGTRVPLHSHVDPECFLVLAGAVEVFAEDGRGWRTVSSGRSVTVENGIPHALEVGSEAAEILVATNHRLAGFFREANLAERGGRRSGPPSPEDVARIRDLSAAYGYWTSSPEEHAARTGRALPAP